MPYYPDSNPYYGSSQPPPYYTSSSSYSPATSRISSPYSFSYMSPISAMLSASIGTNPLPRGLRSYSPMLSAISETSSSPLIPRRDISGHRNSPRRLPKTYFRQPRPVTIDTDNIDLTKRKNSDNDEESTPGTISRGRTTVRMHTKKLKENPLLKKKKTQAELLMEKYLIKDKPTLREEDVPKRKRIWEEREEEVRNEPVRSGTIKRTNTIVKKNNTQLAQPNDEQITDVSSQRKMSTELLKAEAALFDCMIQEELGINNQKEMDIEGENYEKAVDNASLKRNSKREQIPYVRIKSSHSVILDENGLPIEKRKSRALKKKSSKILSLDELNNSSDCPDNNNSSEEITVKPKRRSTKKKKPIMFKIDTLHVEEKSSPKLLKKFNYEVIVEECNKVHDKSPSQSENMFNNMVQKDIPEYSNQEVLDVEYSKKADKSVDSPNNDENTRLSSKNCDNECDIIADNVAKLEKETNNKQFEIINQPTSNDMNAQNNVSSKKVGTNALNKTDNGAKKIVKGCLQRQKATESNSQDQSSLPPLDDLVKEKTDNLTNEYSESKHKPKGSCIDKSVLSSKLNEVTKHTLLDNEGNLNLDTNSTKFDHSKSPLDMKNSHVDSKIPNAISVNSSETETNVSLNRDKDRSTPLKTNNKTTNLSQDIVLGNNTAVFSLNNKQLAEKTHKDKPNLSLSNKDNTPEKGRQLLEKIAPKSAPTTPVLTKKVSSFESANISQDNKVLPEIKQITEAAKTLPSSVEEKKEIKPLITEVKSTEQTILLQNKGKVSEFDKKFSNNTLPKSAPTTPILSKRTAQSPISNTKSTKCSSIVQCSATTVNKGTNNENDLLGSIEKGNVNKNSAQIAQNNKTSSLQTSEIALSKSIVSAQKKKEICEQDNTGSKRLVDDSSTVKKINQTVVCEGGFKSKKTDPVKTSDPSKSTVNGSDLINQGNTTGLVKSVPEKNPPKDDCLNVSSKNKEKVNLQQSHTNINRLEIATVSQILSNNEPTQPPNVKNAIKTNVSNANLNKNLSNPDKNKFKLLKNETLINVAISAPLSRIDSESSQIYHQQDKTRPLGLQSTDYKGKDLEKLSENNKGQINLKANTSPEKTDNTNLISGKKELNKLVQKADKKGEETKMESHLKVDTNIVSDCAKTKNNFQTLNETAQKIAPKKPGNPSQIENKPSVGFENISTNKLNFIKTAGSEIATSEKPKSPIMDSNKKLLGKIGKIDKINEISLEKKAVLSKPDEKLANATTSSAKHLKSDLNKEVLEKDEKGVGNQKQSKSAVSDKSCGNTSQSEILAHPKSLEFKESKENKLEMSQSKCNQNILKPIKSELSDISKQLNQNLLVSSNENTQVKSAFEQLGKKCTKPNKGAQQLHTATNETVDLKEGSKKKRIKSESDVPENQDNDLNKNPLKINIMKNEDEKKSKSLKETETKQSSSKKKKSKDKNSSKEKKDSKSPKKLKDPLKSQEKLDKLNKKVSAVESQVQEQTESSSRRDIDKEKSEILDISTVELSKRSTRLMHFINKCVKLSSDNESLSVEISDEDLSTSSSSEFSTDSECTSDSEESSTDDSECDVNCHRKCEKLMPNLCGVNQKLIVEALSSLRKGSSSEHGSRDHGSPTRRQHNAALSLDEEKEQPARQHGRITPPATTIPKFRKYAMDDFQFLKVLGKGSFGKVLLAELRGTQYYYAVKCLKKDVVLEDDDVECTLIERKVLALGTNHPYLCHLFCTFQTDSHLFFVMEYLNGGDLMFHIQQQGRFDEGRARFYSAEIVSGLKFLHKKGIVYRDLKLDNILLDFDGHVRIADFGMCKLQIFLDRTADTFCGTPDYMAPEIIKGLKYNQCVDWWSFGILMYEMLVGQSPFSGCDEDDLFWCICNRQPHYPRFITMEAKRILTQLLEKEANKRLGSCENGAQEVMGHSFFNGLDWDRLERRELVPPFKPNVKHPLDVHYFDKHFTAERACLTPIDPSILQSMDQTQFQGFSYTNPNVTE